MNLLPAGTPAPEFSLESHQDKRFSLADYKLRRNVLLVFYGLDFTPEASQVVPGLDGLRGQFEELNVEVLACSVDSTYCHQAWANGFGGLEVPLLADFHPAGEIAHAYGAWNEELGCAASAAVLIDTSGAVLEGTADPDSAEAVLDWVREALS